MGVVFQFTQLLFGKEIFAVFRFSGRDCFVQIVDGNRFFSRQQSLHPGEIPGFAPRRRVLALVIGHREKIAFARMPEEKLCDFGRKAVGR